MWLIASPVLLALLLIVLLYLPPVQRWAVDRASEWLSEEMKMDVTVSRVGLRFPLNLYMNDLLAVRLNDNENDNDNDNDNDNENSLMAYELTSLKRDTIADAKALDVRVQLWPLLKGRIEVDRVQLEEAKVNTLDLIEAVGIKGKVGLLTLASHGVDLNTGEVRVNYVILQDTDVDVALADSTTKDTTESQPAAWKIQLDRVQFERVKARLALAPQADSTAVGVNIGALSLHGSLDLQNGRYQFADITLKNTEASYDNNNDNDNENDNGNSHSLNVSTSQLKGLDFNHLSFSNINIDIPKFSYVLTGDMTVLLRQLTARERSGLDIQELSAEISMDSLGIKAEKFVLKTTESDIALDARMDFKAFANPASGTMEAVGTAHIGKGDLAVFAIDALPTFPQAWPATPLATNFDIKGNAELMYVNRLSANMPGVLDLQACGMAENLTDTTGRMAMNIDVKTRMQNLDFVKGLVPPQSRNAFHIPRNMALDGKVGMKDNQALAKLSFTAGKSTVRIDGEMGMKDERYAVDLDMQDLFVNQFVPLADTLMLTGRVNAAGRGFDVFDPHTIADAQLTLEQARYGQIDASHTDALLNLRNGKLSANMEVDNEQLLTGFALNGKVQKKGIDAHLDLNLPHADLRAMGLSEERLEVRTRGVFDVYSNLVNFFNVDAQVRGIDLWLDQDSLHTESFDLHAETQRDTTDATISTGDLFFDFHSPENLFTMLGKFEKIGVMAQRQIKKRELDVNKLKEFLPVTNVEARAGQQNPVSKILKLNGITFNDLKANLQTNPEEGLVGDAHLYTLRYDTLSVDTVFFDLKQDSTKFSYKTGVVCSDQAMFQGFSAYLNGYVATTDADVHLTFFNDKHEQGIDIGLAAFVADSALNAKFYPEEPILGFRRFQLNEDNFLRLEKKNRMFADVHMTSLDDSCRIHFEANPADSLLQDIRAVVKNLDLEQIIAVVPGMPKMSGLFNIDLDYEQNFDRFWVNGSTGIDNFAYEGTPVGNVAATFDYDPVGTLVHNVKSKISHNNHEVAYFEGTYSAETAEGYLDAKLQLIQLPLSMAAPFIPDQIITFEGAIGGDLSVRGPTNKLNVNGEILPNGMKVLSEVYSLNLSFANEPFTIENSRINFNRYSIYSAGKPNPLTLNGWVDFADTEEIALAISIYGRNFQLISAPRTRKSLVFGNMYGDFMARINGTLNDLRVRGLINVLGKTDMTYVMSETPLSVDNRLDDIVTFVDFNAPPERHDAGEKNSFMGLEMQVTLQIEDGAQFHCEFSADRQSYINVQGGGSLVLNQTPEGVMNLIGRYTINEGEMKYTLPVIPLKTFNIKNGSYVEFNGVPDNPTINFTATEETRATVSDASGQSRSVLFNAGLKVTGTLENMELVFTIDAPEDMSVQNELAAMSAEDKNKMAVGLLCTGMYLSSSNSNGISANNALNNFLQNEINNIAGKAMQTVVDMNVGMEQSTRDDGTTRTDYAFKFSKRFFSNRLNVVVGGKVNADGNTQANESGAYIDNVSLEWRLDNGGNRYVRIYHETSYDNLLEGELVENGASIVLRKKYDKLSDLIIWKKKQ